MSTLCSTKKMVVPHYTHFNKSECLNSVRNKMSGPSERLKLLFKIS